MILMVAAQSLLLRLPGFRVLAGRAVRTGPKELLLAQIEPVLAKVLLRQAQQGLWLRCFGWGLCGRGWWSGSGFLAQQCLAGL